MKVRCNDVVVYSNQCNAPPSFIADGTTVTNLQTAGCSKSQAQSSPFSLRNCGWNCSECMKCRGFARIRPDMSLRAVETELSWADLARGSTELGCSGYDLDTKWGGHFPNMEGVVDRSALSVL